MPAKARGVPTGRGKERLFRNDIKNVHLGIGQNVIGRHTISLLIDRLSSEEVKEQFSNTDTSILRMEMFEMQLYYVSTDFCTLKRQLEPLCINHKVVLHYQQRIAKILLYALTHKVEGEAYYSFLNVTLAFSRELGHFFLPYSGLFVQALFRGLYDLTGRNVISKVDRVQLIFIAVTRLLQECADAAETDKNTKTAERLQFDIAAMQRCISIILSKTHKDSKEYIRRLGAEALASLCRRYPTYLRDVVIQMMNGILVEFGALLPPDADEATSEEENENDGKPNTDGDDDDEENEHSDVESRKGEEVITLNEIDFSRSRVADSCIFFIKMLLSGIRGSLSTRFEITLSEVAEILFNFCKQQTTSLSSDKNLYEPLVDGITFVFRTTLSDLVYHVHSDSTKTAFLRIVTGVATTFLNIERLPLFLAAFHDILTSTHNCILNQLCNKEDGTDELTKKLAEIFGVLTKMVVKVSNEGMPKIALLILSHSLQLLVPMLMTSTYDNREALTCGETLVKPLLAETGRVLRRFHERSRNQSKEDEEDDYASMAVEITTLFLQDTVQKVNARVNANAGFPSVGGDDYIHILPVWEDFYCATLMSLISIYNYKSAKSTRERYYRTTHDAIIRLLEIGQSCQTASSLSKQNDNNNNFLKNDGKNKNDREGKDVIVMTLLQKALSNARPIGPKPCGNTRNELLKMAEKDIEKLVRTDTDNNALLFLNYGEENLVTLGSWISFVSLLGKLQHDSSLIKKLSSCISAVHDALVHAEQSEIYGDGERFGKLLQLYVSGVVMVGTTTKTEDYNEYDNLSKKGKQEGEKGMKRSLKALISEIFNAIPVEYKPKVLLFQQQQSARFSINLQESLPPSSVIYTGIANELASGSFANALDECNKTLFYTLLRLGVRNNQNSNNDTKENAVWLDMFGFNEDKEVCCSNNNKVEDLNKFLFFLFHTLATSRSQRVRLTVLQLLKDIYEYLITHKTLREKSAFLIMGFDDEENKVENSEGMTKEESSPSQVLLPNASSDVEQIEKKNINETKKERICYDLNTFNSLIQSEKADPVTDGIDSKAISLSHILLDAGTTNSYFNRYNKRSDSFMVQLVARYMVGLYHVKFAGIWPSATRVVVNLLKNEFALRAQEQNTDKKIKNGNEQTYQNLIHKATMSKTTTTRKTNIPSSSVSRSNQLQEFWLWDHLVKPLILRHALTTSEPSSKIKCRTQYFKSKSSLNLEVHNNASNINSTAENENKGRANLCFLSLTSIAVTNDFSSLEKALFFYPLTFDDAQVHYSGAFVAKSLRVIEATDPSSRVVHKLDEGEPLTANDVAFKTVAPDVHAADVNVTTSFLDVLISVAPLIGVDFKEKKKKMMRNDIDINNSAVFVPTATERCSMLSLVEQLLLQLAQIDQGFHPTINSGSLKGFEIRLEMLMYATSIQYSSHSEILKRLLLFDQTEKVLKGDRMTTFNDNNVFDNQDIKKSIPTCMKAFYSYITRYRKNTLKNIFSHYLSHPSSRIQALAIEGLRRMGITPFDKYYDKLFPLVGGRVDFYKYATGTSDTDKKSSRKEPKRLKSGTATYALQFLNTFGIEVISPVDQTAYLTALVLICLPVITVPGGIGGKKGQKVIRDREVLGRKVFGYLLTVQTSQSVEHTKTFTLLASAAGPSSEFKNDWGLNTKNSYHVGNLIVFLMMRIVRPFMGINEEGNDEWEEDGSLSSGLGDDNGLSKSLFHPFFLSSSSAAAAAAASFPSNALAKSFDFCAKIASEYVRILETSASLKNYDTLENQTLNRGSIIARQRLLRRYDATLKQVTKALRLLAQLIPVLGTVLGEYSFVCFYMLMQMYRVSSPAHVAEAIKEILREHKRIGEDNHYTINPSFSSASHCNSMEGDGKNQEKNLSAFTIGNDNNQTDFYLGGRHLKRGQDERSTVRRLSSDLIVDILDIFAEPIGDSLLRDFDCNALLCRTLGDIYQNACGGYHQLHQQSFNFLMADTTADATTVVAIDSKKNNGKDGKSFDSRSLKTANITIPINVKIVQVLLKHVSLYGVVAQNAASFIVPSMTRALLGGRAGISFSEAEMNADLHAIGALFSGADSPCQYLDLVTRCLVKTTLRKSIFEEFGFTLFKAIHHLVTLTERSVLSTDTSAAAVNVIRTPMPITVVANDKDKNNVSVVPSTSIATVSSPRARTTSVYAPPCIRIHTWKQVMLVATMLPDYIVTTTIATPQSSPSLLQTNTITSHDQLQLMLSQLLDIALRFARSPLCATSRENADMAGATICAIIDKMDTISEERHYRALVGLLNVVTAPAARTSLCQALALAVGKLGTVKGDDEKERQMAAVCKVVKALNSFPERQRRWGDETKKVWGGHNKVKNDEETKDSEMDEQLTKGDNDGQEEKLMGSDIEKNVAENDKRKSKKLITADTMKPSFVFTPITSSPISFYAFVNQTKRHASVIMNLDYTKYDYELRYHTFNYLSHFFNKDGNYNNPQHQNALSHKSKNKKAKQFQETMMEAQKRTALHEFDNEQYGKKQQGNEPSFLPPSTRKERLYREEEDITLPLMHVNDTSRKHEKKSIELSPTTTFTTITTIPSVGSVPTLCNEALQALISNVLFFLRDRERTIRTFASECLSAIIGFMARRAQRTQEGSTTPQGVIEAVIRPFLLPTLRRGVAAKSLDVRKEAMLALGQLARHFSQLYPSLAVLFSHNSEGNFYSCIVSGVHKIRMRALGMLRSKIGEMNHREVLRIFVPFLIAHIKDISQGKQDSHTSYHPGNALATGGADMTSTVEDNLSVAQKAGFAEALLQTLATVGMHMPWEGYYYILSILLIEAKTHEAMRPIMLRGAVRMLEAFHFLDVEEVTEEKHGEGVKEGNIEKRWGRGELLHHKNADDITMGNIIGIEGGDEGETDAAMINTIAIKNNKYNYENDEENDDKALKGAAEATALMLRKERKNARIVNVLEDDILPQLYSFIRSSHGSTANLLRTSEGVKFSQSQHKKTIDGISTIDTVFDNRLDSHELSQENSISVRLPVAVAILKVIRLLPENKYDYHVSVLLADVAQKLRTKNERQRSAARRVLCSMMNEVGPTKLRFVVKVLKNNLVHGYQLHVLGYSLAMVLQSMFGDKEGNSNNNNNIEGNSLHAKIDDQSVTDNEEDVKDKEDTMEEKDEDKKKLAEHKEGNDLDADAAVFKQRRTDTAQAAHEAASLGTKRARQIQAKKKNLLFSSRKGAAGLTHEEEERRLVSKAFKLGASPKRIFSVEEITKALDDTLDILFDIFLNDYLGETSEQKEASEFMSTMIEVKHNKAMQGFGFLATHASGDLAMKLFLTKIVQVLDPQGGCFRVMSFNFSSSRGDGVCGVTNGNNSPFMSLSASQPNSSLYMHGNCVADARFIERVRKLALHVTKGLTLNKTLTMSTALSSSLSMLDNNNSLREKKITEFEAKDGTRRIRGNIDSYTYVKKLSRKEQFDKNYGIDQCPQRIDGDFSSHTFLATNTQQKQKLRAYRGRYAKSLSNNNDVSKSFRQEDKVTAVVLDTLDEFNMKFLLFLLKKSLGIGRLKAHLMKSQKKVEADEGVREDEAIMEYKEMVAEVNFDGAAEGKKVNEENEKKEEKKKNDGDEDDEMQGQDENEKLQRMDKKENFAEDQDCEDKEDDIDVFEKEQRLGNNDEDGEKKLTLHNQLSEAGRAVVTRGQKHKNSFLSISSKSDTPLRLKEKFATAIFSEHFSTQLNDLLFPVLTTVQGEGADAVISTSLAVIHTLISLYPPLSSIRNCGQLLMETLVDLFARGGAIKAKAMRVMAALIHHKFFTLTTDQAVGLCKMARAEIVGRTSHLSMSLSIFASVIDRQVEIVEVYDLIAPVTETMMHFANNASVRTCCVSILSKFLTEYRMTIEKVCSHIDVFVQNLQYPTSTGQLAMLELLGVLSYRLPQVILQQEFNVIFIPVVHCMGASQWAGCQQKAAEVTQALVLNAGLEPVSKTVLAWTRSGSTLEAKTTAMRALAVIVPLVPKLYGVNQKETRNTYENEDDSEETERNFVISSALLWCLPAIARAVQYRHSFSRSKLKELHKEAEIWVFKNNKTARKLLKRREKQHQSSSTKLLLFYDNDDDRITIEHAITKRFNEILSEAQDSIAWSYTFLGLRALEAVCGMSSYMFGYFAGELEIEDEVDNDNDVNERNQDEKDEEDVKKKKMSGNDTVDNEQQRQRAKNVIRTITKRLIIHTHSWVRNASLRVLHGYLYRYVEFRTPYTLSPRTTIWRSHTKAKAAKTAVPATAAAAKQQEPAFFVVAPLEIHKINITHNNDNISDVNNFVTVIDYLAFTESAPSFPVTASYITNAGDLAGRLLRLVEESDVKDELHYGYMAMDHPQRQILVETFVYILRVLVVMYMLTTRHTTTLVRHESEKDTNESLSAITAYRSVWRQMLNMIRPIAVGQSVRGYLVRSATMIQVFQGAFTMLPFANITAVTADTVGIDVADISSSVERSDKSASSSAFSVSTFEEANALQFFAIKAVGLETIHSTVVPFLACCCESGDNSRTIAQLAHKAVANLIGELDVRQSMFNVHDMCQDDILDSKRERSQIKKKTGKKRQMRSSEVEPHEDFSSLPLRKVAKAQSISSASEGMTTTSSAATGTTITNIAVRLAHISDAIREKERQEKLRNLHERNMKKKMWKLEIEKRYRKREWPNRQGNTNSNKNIEKGKVCVVGGVKKVMKMKGKRGKF